MSDQNKLSRRDFIAQTAALGAGALLTIGAPVMGYAARTVPTVKLGKTGQIVPKLSFGTAFNLTPQLVRIALNEGLNYLDTAEGYNNGNSERSIGDMLSKLTNRKDCFIVSKTGRHDPAGLPDKLQGSLERLQTDYVDSYYLHNLGNPDLLNDDMKAAAEKLKKEGKIRFFGFSSHHRNMIQTLEKAAEVGFVDMIMFKYNFWDYDNDALNKAIDKCAKANIGLIAMKTQGGAATVPDKVDQFKAKGFNPFQAALKAVWADDRIHAICSEMTNIKQVHENTTAAREKDMGSIERQRLEEYASANSHLYCRGCGHICENNVNGPVNIADTLRYRLYHNGYGKHEDARRLFAELPAHTRNIANIDFSAAEKACPHNLPIGKMMREAVQILT